MKKIICIALMAAMTAAAITACGNNGTADTTTTESTTTTEATTETTTEATSETTAASEETPADTDASDNEEADTSSTTDVILGKIREAYGDDYLPNELIPGEMIESVFGLTEDMYSAVTAEMPMISAYPDTVVVVEAKEGKVDDVEAALNAYRDYQVNEALQYPMNVAKVNASKVVKNGNFVAFIMAGAIDERGDVSDEDMASFAQEQTQIGVDAFNSCF